MLPQRLSGVTPEPFMGLGLSQQNAFVPKSRCLLVHYRFHFSYVNIFAFIGKVKPDTPENVLQALVAKRMKHTARYHMECLVVWIILPIAIQIVNLLSNTPWRRGSVWGAVSL